jgi:hypothetical protein
VALVDLDQVPMADLPESWGRRDDWLATVREQRLRERQQAGKMNYSERQYGWATGRRAQLVGLLAMHILVAYVMYTYM